jgi:GNAT superfamily N-acetyltransferase
VAGADGEPRVVGCAIWFLSFSTWTGRNGIWLEDLYVTPDQRGSGLGQALLATLAEICVERGYTRLEWMVLDWNEPSIGFYRSIGAESMDEWTRFRLDGDALSAVSGLGR